MPPITAFTRSVKVPLTPVIDRLQCIVKTVKKLNRFKDWISSVPDERVRAAIAQRVERLAMGLPGDVESVGGGIFELRIHLGAGWRVYFIEVGDTLILLLTGGMKKSQAQDIKMARQILTDIQIRQQEIAKRIKKPGEPHE